MVQAAIDQWYYCLFISHVLCVVWSSILPECTIFTINSNTVNSVQTSLSNVSVESPSIRAVTRNLLRLSVDCTRTELGLGI